MDPDPDPTDHLFLDHPDPSLFCTDPYLYLDPDPSINKQKNLDFYYFATSFWLFIYETDVNVPSKSNSKKNDGLCGLGSEVQSLKL